MAAALANQLGISTSKVKAALESVRPSGTPPPAGTTPS
jgi:UDP-N-acetylmuramyl pentapeptide synthase